MHLESARDQHGTVQNVLRDGRHLNAHVHDLTAEVRRCWNEWIIATGDQALKEFSESAEASAHNDVARLRGMIK